MNPYRVSAVPTPEPKGKPRSRAKTLWWKLQIRVRGTWKQRYHRCDQCLKVFKRVSGDYIDAEPMFHRIQHYALEQHAAAARRSPIIPPDPVMIEE